MRRRTGSNRFRLKFIGRKRVRRWSRIPEMRDMVVVGRERVSFEMQIHCGWA
jgi:hypothetical protein